MSMPPYSFGSVLYDELEQVAVRRGGFSSLKALRDDVIMLKADVIRSADACKDLAETLPSLRTESDRVAREADKVLGRVSEAARCCPGTGTGCPSAMRNRELCRGKNPQARFAIASGRRPLTAKSISSRRGPDSNSECAIGMENQEG